MDVVLVMHHIVTQHMVWTPTKQDYGDTVLATDRNVLTTQQYIATRRGALVIKVSGHMPSSAFKRNLSFSLTVILLA